jgi:superfamily II DNA helicase RecQ
VNKDNHDDKIFTDLAKGLFQICYASLECLLHNPRFKKLFRQEDFRRRVIVMVVDEAHVIEDWKNEFRKDYGKLEILKIIMGIEIPWLAVTGTSSTKNFETIYRMLGMGGARPFYGIDRGSDPSKSQAMGLSYGVLSIVIG